MQWNKKRKTETWPLTEIATMNPPPIKGTKITDMENSKLNLIIRMILMQLKGKEEIQARWMGLRLQTREVTAGVGYKFWLSRRGRRGRTWVFLPIWGGLKLMRGRPSTKATQIWTWWVQTLTWAKIRKPWPNWLPWKKIWCRISPRISFKKRTGGASIFPQLSNYSKAINYNLSITSPRRNSELLYYNHYLS